MKSYHLTIWKMIISYYYLGIDWLIDITSFSILSHWRITNAVQWQRCQPCNNDNGDMTRIILLDNVVNGGCVKGVVGRLDWNNLDPGGSIAQQRFTPAVAMTTVVSAIMAVVGPRIPPQQTQVRTFPPST